MCASVKMSIKNAFLNVGEYEADDEGPGIPIGFHFLTRLDFSSTFSCVIFSIFFQAGFVPLLDFKCGIAAGY